jgi:hypothetical protein
MFMAVLLNVRLALFGTARWNEWNTADAQMRYGMPPVVGVSIGNGVWSRQ